MFDINSIGGSIGWRYKNFQNHRLHRATALEVADRIASVKGPLPKSVIKHCDDYASDVLGRRYFAPWLYVYSAVSGAFKEGWIPDNYYVTHVVPKLSGAYGDVSYLKPLNYRIFGSESFPDLGSHVNGMFFDREYKIIPDRKVRPALFAKNSKIVFKVDSSEQGVGVFFFDENSFSLDEIRNRGNGVFQGFIRQHALLAGFANDSVATLRITTYADQQGVVSPRACYLRLGSGSDTHVQSRSHIRVPINLADGRLFDLGYTADWLQVDAHPTSRERFAGKTIPSFQACVDRVSDLHRKVSFVRCVGWDVAIDANGQPQVMEWNGGHNDIKFSEATQGPCFADLHWEQYRPTGADLYRAFF